MNRRDLFRNSLSIAVAGTAATGIITAATIEKADLTLPLHIFTGKEVEIESIKLQIEELIRLIRPRHLVGAAYLYSEVSTIPPKMYSLMNQLKELSFEDWLLYMSLVYDPILHEEYIDWYGQSNAKREKTLSRLRI